MSPIEQSIDWAFAIKEGLDDLFHHFKKKSLSTSLYNARFTSFKEVLRYGYRGFCLNGIRSISTKRSYENALVIGGTGAGKSSTVLIPSILRMNGSFVINDPSGQLYYYTAGHLQRKDYKIKVINFSDSQKGEGYNPLLRATTSSLQNQAAYLLVRTALGEAKDPFWNLQATSLLQVIIRALNKRRSEYRNLTNARHIATHIAKDGKALQSFFHDPEYEAFLAYDQKVRGSILATVFAALQLFTDEHVALTTSFDTLDLYSIRKEKTAIFIHTPVHQQHYFKTLNSLFFEQLFSILLSRLPQKNELDVFCLLDEAGSSLLLPSLATYIAQVRKYRVGILLALQDLNQLIANYGNAVTEIVLSNTFAKLYLAGQSIRTAKSLETLLGVVEVEGKFRPLITTDEIRTLSKREGLLLCGNHHPMKVPLTPYYQHLLFQYQSRFKPPTLSRELPFSQVPLLPLHLN